MQRHTEPLPTPALAECYSLYQQVRDDLHTLELTEADAALQANALERTLNAKGQIARAAFALYANSGSTQEFMGKVEENLMSDPGFTEEAYRMGTDDAMLGAYLHPLSLLHDDIPSPVESICATARNLEIVRDFVRPVEGIATGMLMSGANAWGAFYAVKGGVPDVLKDEGVPQLPYGEISDIDLIVSADSIAELSLCVDSYVAAGLVEPRERERFAAYRKLYDRGEADVFSLRSYYREVEESIHFLPTEVVERICSMTGGRAHVDSNGLRYDIIRDFRPNIPGNVRRYGSYPLADVRGLRTTDFYPDLTEMQSHDGSILGYLSESAIGGPAEVDGENTYYMGVFSSFFAVDPVLLIDRGGWLSQMSAMLHNNISKILNGAEVRFIPRQGRMAVHSLARIRHMLQYGNDGLSQAASERAVQQD